MGCVMGQNSSPTKAKLCKRTEAIIAVVRGSSKVLAFAGSDVQRAYREICRGWYDYGRPVGFGGTDAAKKGWEAILKALREAFTVPHE